MQKCPICETEIKDEDFCEECGWQFEYFLKKLSDKEMESYQKRIGIHRKLYHKVNPNKSRKFYTVYGVKEIKGQALEAFNVYETESEREAKEKFIKENPLYAIRWGYFIDEIIPETFSYEDVRRAEKLGFEMSHDCMVGDALFKKINKNYKFIILNYVDKNLNKKVSNRYDYYYWTISKQGVIETMEYNKIFLSESQKNMPFSKIVELLKSYSHIGNSNIIDYYPIEVISNEELYLGKFSCRNKSENEVFIEEEVVGISQKEIRENNKIISGKNSPLTVQNYLAWEDTDTGLIWEVKRTNHISFNKVYKLSEAEKYVEKLNNEKYANLSCWKLPTKQELETLLSEYLNNGLYVKNSFTLNGYGDGFGRYFCLVGDEYSNSTFEIAPNSIKFTDGNFDNWNFDIKQYVICVCNVNMNHFEYFDKANVDKTLNEEYNRAIEGDNHSQYLLALNYQQGTGGIEQNYFEAKKWYEKSARQGHMDAQFYLGWLYTNGYCGKKDFTEAMKWYMQSAEQGGIGAMANIGWIYQNSDNNYIEAVKWYEKAAKLGELYAQNNLGYCYQWGLGVNQNLHTAKEWYKKALLQGHPDAENNLKTIAI